MLSIVGLKKSRRENMLVTKVVGLKKSWMKRGKCLG